jgi:hypothetical protein
VNLGLPPSLDATLALLQRPLGADTVEKVAG